MKCSKAVDLVREYWAADGDGVAEVVAHGQILDSDTVCVDLDPGVQRVDAVDEHVVAVTAANDDVFGRDEDFFGVDPRFDEDEVAGLGEVDGFLNRECVRWDTNGADGRCWQRRYWGLDDLAIGGGAVEDWRSNVITISGRAACEDEDARRQNREKFPAIHNVMLVNARPLVSDTRFVDDFANGGGECAAKGVIVEDWDFVTCSNAVQ